MLANVFHTLFLWLPFAYHHTSNGIEWNYLTNGKTWTDLCATGKQQSPIAFDIQKTRELKSPRIYFANYNVELKGPIFIKNNGHTISMDIPATINGQPPFISGGRLRGRYLAKGLHFHWGSPNSNGSEHTINNRRYDAEMHIVHRNAKYIDIIDAAEKKDGLAVIGVLLEIVKEPIAIPTGLTKVINAVIETPMDESNTTIPAGFSLDEMIGNVDHNDFLSYDGSLTTPFCHEAVSWTVFTQILPVSFSMVSKLWKLRDRCNHPMINNFRDIQDLNNRPVYHRFGRA
nr:putative carbonic anhydrase 3 [Drosophila suzukii]